MSVLPQLIVNSLIAAGTYAILAMGFSLIYGTTKFFNLAHGVMAAVGGYCTFWLLGAFSGLPLWVMVIVSVIVAGLLGYLVDRIVYLPLRKRKASNMVLLVASLGAFTVIQAAIAMIFTSQFQTLALPNSAAQSLGGLASAASENVYQIAGASITETQTMILGAAILVFVFLWLLLKKTLFGKAIRAISDDEEVAKIAGINTEKIIGWTFFVGSAISGLAGILIGFDTGIEPTMGMELLLKGVIAAIVGGVGSISGAALGALLLGFAENFGIWKISGEWKDSIAFALLILFLIFRPKGIIQK
jgi:branched-subunit amino acid ABC-type transport system permease component